MLSFSADMCLAAMPSGTWSEDVRPHLGIPVRHKLYDCVSCLNRVSEVGVASLFCVGFSISTSASAHGIWHTGDPVDAEFQRFSYDVLVIVRRGRTASCDRSAAAAPIGVVCNRCSAKPHRHGRGRHCRCAANVDIAKLAVHFAIHAGGSTSQLAHGRTARQEAPECVRELEAWGALRPHKDGRILQRNFGAIVSAWPTLVIAPGWR